MWNSFENRKFPRVEKECGISVATPEKSEAFSSVTENVGIGGFCLHLPKPLAPFSKVRIKLILDSAAEPFECEARVAWSIPQRNFDPKLVNYDIGFEFLDLTREQRVRLEQFLTTAA